MRPSPSQMSYIDQLYEILSVPFSQRERPKSRVEAHFLIDSLIVRGQEMKDEAFLVDSEEYERIHAGE